MEQPREESADEPEAFWKELRCTVHTPCNNHEQIDDALRAWLGLVSSGRDVFLQDEDDLARCSRCLLESPLCAGLDVRQYVRTQIIYSLLQEEESGPLHAIANYLLLAGRHDESVFTQMIEAGCFARLVELIKVSHVGDRRLHRLLLELMYEMACIERVHMTDLLSVDDSFVSYLFQIVEDLSDDLDDPYHFPVIRVLYMVAATSAAAADPNSSAASLTNRVVKILSLNGPLFRTFGENIILLLNRATETALQLLILKLLYLLFTTHATYEYFYTNDLRVLLDVIIRNLLDLPNESASLRHTYLRVLYPLLAHTQLNQPPHYKRGEILRVLAILSGSGNFHFAPADETTVRLVGRVAMVEWLHTPTPPTSTPVSPTSSTRTLGTVTTLGTTATARTSTSSSAASVDTAGTVLTDDSNDADAVASGADHNPVINKLLGISLAADGRESRASVDHVAAVKEKPGVKTPSRKADLAEIKHHAEAGAKDDYDAWAAEVTEAVPSANTTSPISTVISAFEPDEDSIKHRRTEPSAACASKAVPPLVPPERKSRMKRILPAVPTHRHGVLMRQPHPLPPPPPPAAASAAAGKALAGVGAGPAAAHPSSTSPPTDASLSAAAAAAAAAAHTTHTCSHPSHPHPSHQASPAGAGIKKLPPKLPPPRRPGRLKQAASSANLQQKTAQELGLDELAK